ncbi:MAG: Sec-independent protein translocase subunit TatA/TatB [Pseudobdellovibrionaceae bacterium]
MLGLSLSEIIFLAILALIVIGPKQLPEVARTLGRFLNELRRASNSMKNELQEHVKIAPTHHEEKASPIPEERSENSEVKKS